jgi:alkyl hydroperoxide reductase subunit F
MPVVKVYSTKSCPYCRMVKAFLAKQRIEYQDIDVGADKAAAREMVELTGQYAVPVTTVGDEVIIGFDAPRLNELFGTERRDEPCDVLIVGGGPAGLTAAVYCARKLLKTTMVTSNIGGQALESWAIENYMGYRMVTGEDLMKKFEEQVRLLNIHVELDQANAVSREGELFVVRTVSDQTFRAKSLIITTGRSPRWLGLPDEKKFIGHGLSVCATCDGPLFKDKTVAVVGGGNSALTTALEMSAIATTVHLIARSTIRADEFYQSAINRKSNLIVHLNTQVTALSGDQHLKGITIRNSETGREDQLAIEGLFLEIGQLPNTGFLSGFVTMTDGGEIDVDQNCHTSTEGVFAAGDVTDVKGKQIIIAAGEGAKAALEVHEYLVKKESLG